MSPPPLFNRGVPSTEPATPAWEYITSYRLQDYSRCHPRGPPHRRRPRTTKSKQPSKASPCTVAVGPSGPLCYCMMFANICVSIEHLQKLFNQDQVTTNTSIHHYKMILRTIFDQTPVVSQTVKVVDTQQVVTTLTPTYLCLQCPSTVTEEDRIKHGNKKSHRFYVDSRSAALYCQMCDDMVYDPTFEELRLKKLGTSTFSNSMPSLFCLSVSLSITNLYLYCSTETQARRALLARSCQR